MEFRNCAQTLNFPSTHDSWRRVKKPAGTWFFSVISDGAAVFGSRIRVFLVYSIGWHTSVGHSFLVVTAGKATILDLLKN